MGRPPLPSAVFRQLFRCHDIGMREERKRETHRESLSSPRLRLRLSDIEAQSAQCKSDRLEVMARLPALENLVHAIQDDSYSDGGDFEEDVMFFEASFRLFFSVPEPRPKILGYIEDLVQSYSGEEVIYSRPLN